jgi:hypothetical protein
MMIRIHNGGGIGTLNWGGGTSVVLRGGGSTVSPNANMGGGAYIWGDGHS